MRRSNFVIGLGVSIVLHAAFLVAVLAVARPAPAPPPARNPVTPIQIVAVDPKEKLPLDPLPESPEPLPLEPAVEPDPAPAPPAPPAPPQPTELSEVTDIGESPPQVEPMPARPPPRPPDRDPSPAPALAAAPQPEPPPDRPPGRMPGDGDAEYVPPLRVHWADARELITVARILGLRLAAVSREAEIIAEIDLSDSPGLRAWRGLPYGYSNRVRMLSPSIFASRLRDDGVEEIHEIWVFVPLDRDRAMIEAQRAAVRRAGARPEDVLYVDGRFVRAANGSYRLDITNVRLRGPRRHHG